MIATRYCSRFRWTTSKVSTTQLHRETSRRKQDIGLVLGICETIFAKALITLGTRETWFEIDWNPARKELRDKTMPSTRQLPSFSSGASSFPRVLHCQFPNASFWRCSTLKPHIQYVKSAQVNLSLLLWFLHTPQLFWITYNDKRFLQKNKAVYAPSTVAQGNSKPIADKVLHR